MYRNQVSSRLKDIEGDTRVDTTVVDTTGRTSWGNITPSARSLRSSGLRSTSLSSTTINSTLRPSAVSEVSTKATVDAPIKRSVTFVYDAGPHNLSNLQLKGSWNKTTGLFDPQWGGGDGVAMTNLGNGKWAVTLDLVDDGLAKNWEWGVVADGPTGKSQWVVMGEGNLKFNLNENTKTVNYAPTTYHEMGSQKHGNDISFKFWAPNAQQVSVKVFDEFGRTQLIPMKRDSEGNWSAMVKNGWSQMEGKGYVYQLIDSSGATLERTDPYARVMQGEQTGIGRVYIDTKTGREVNPFHIDPEVYQQLRPQIEGPDPAVADTARQKAYAMSRAELVKFEIDDQENAESAYLVFKDENGRQLTKDELINRLGRFDSGLIDKLRGGKYNDLWSNNIDEQGRIKMSNAGGTWTTLVNNLDRLTGTRYEFQVYQRDANGQLTIKGDTNRDGNFSEDEVKASKYNDRWSNVIGSESGRTFRGSVIKESNYNWKHSDAPREKDHNKWVIYQLHVGSFLGKNNNNNRSTFEDLMKKLDYFKSLGVNTIELMPVNEVEGERDWGYMGVNSLAIESTLGFEDENGNLVTGADALKMFIDMAHSKGLNVINDVVYNHIGGAHNFLWNIDGKENAYFNWSKEPGKFEKRDTPWGAMPAYNNPKVRQLFVDHAVMQMQEFNFDGLRFDFTEPMKGTGGRDGWDMMREMNRQLHFFRPGFFTAAEQFDYDPAITRPALPDGTGAGFDTTWYTEYQHRLVRDNDNPSIIQQAVNGWRTNMDQFMNLLTNPRKLDSWSKAVTVISNHDEVGNAQRTIDVADGNSTAKIPPQWARNVARFAAGIGLASPGIPIFFQGDESMAANSFKWGTPSTWDSGWDWESLGKDWDWNSITFNDDQRRLYNNLLEMPQQERENNRDYRNLQPADREVFNYLSGLSPAEREDAMLNIARRQTYNFYKDALALRSSSPAFEADAELKRVYTHNDNSVMAFTRKEGNDEFLVVASLNKNNLQSYRMDLPPGQWKEVLNSDAARYGGSNFGNFGALVNGGSSQMNIPAGGYVVFKKV
ncbi:MAG: alpha amylase C-terminal domain-containing protein [Blastocatellia bacterium]|nr:alpha amylase C-terminal domain-containing protein [Blastocatellia bacterium]